MTSIPCHNTWNPSAENKGQADHVQRICIWRLTSSLRLGTQCMLSLVFGYPLQHPCFVWAPPVLGTSQLSRTVLSLSPYHVPNSPSYNFLTICQKLLHLPSWLCKVAGIFLKTCCLQEKLHFAKSLYSFGIFFLMYNLNFSFLNFLFIFLSVLVFCLHVCLCTDCVPDFLWDQKRPSDPWDGVPDRCEPPSWSLNPGPLEEQPPLFITKSSP